MRYLSLGLLAFFSTSTFAQEAMKHEPVSNKAEYYIGTFNDRKDRGDLLDWAADHVEWQKQYGLYESMSSHLLTPYFISDTTTHDVVWLNIWPNATDQYAGLENWLENGEKQVSKLPVTNSQVVDTYQWALSVPEGEGSIGMVRFSDCKLKDGVTNLQAFNSLKEYVYSLYANNTSEIGSNSDLYWAEINGSDEDLALNAIIDSCSNYRTYSSIEIKGAE